MGMAAASTDPLETAAKASAERAKGTMTASATRFIAASWLNEPGSPWMAIFIPLRRSPLCDFAEAAMETLC